MDILIASIIIIGLMLFFVFIMFKNIIKRINFNAKKYFVDKLDDYNYIVEGKEHEIDKLNKEIGELIKQKEKLENQKVLSPVASVPRRKMNTKPIYDIKIPKYREENFFVNYRELKKEFDFDKEELIKSFMEKYQTKKNEKDYKTLNNFKKKFSKDTIYQLMTLKGEDQLDIINTIVTETEKKLIDVNNIIEDKSKFNVMLLLKEIDELMLKVDPVITVYVSEYDKDYDYLDPYIQTKHYSRMSEGLIIEYRGKSYDYSI